MKNLQKLLPACAVVVGVALAALTSAFTVAPKADAFWVLKSGTVASTNPADYMQSTDDGCGNEIHFCGFTAPETAASEPDISGVAGLTQDLTDLHNNTESQSNSSGAVQFKDPS